MMRDRNNMRRKPNNSNNGSNNSKHTQQRRRFRPHDSQNNAVRVKNAQASKDKYTSMARDASLSGDRVLSENYLQHADHYQRIISAIQEEEHRYRLEREQQIAVFESEAEELLDMGSDDNTDNNDSETSHNADAESSEQEFTEEHAPAMAAAQ